MPIDWLELESGGQLHCSRIAAEYLIWFTKDRITRDQINVRAIAIVKLDVAEIPRNILRMIEQVERLSGKLELVPFFECELLFALDVPVVDGSERHGVAAAVCQSAETSNDVLSIGVDRDVSDRTRRAALGCSPNGTGRSRIHDAPISSERGHATTRIWNAINVYDCPVARRVTI